MKSFNHFGVYGICMREGRLLVIHKGRGAYTGRYDLPGEGWRIMNRWLMACSENLWRKPGCPSR